MLPGVRVISLHPQAAALPDYLPNIFRQFHTTKADGPGLSLAAASSKTTTATSMSPANSERQNVRGCASFAKLSRTDLWTLGSFHGLADHFY